MIPTIHDIRHAKEWSELVQDKITDYCHYYNIVRREIGQISNYETIRHVTDRVIEEANEVFKKTHPEYFDKN